MATIKVHSSGRPPQQTNDIKQQILAALADPHCNDKIFLLGGSSRGCHALWVALDPNPTVPGWDATKVANIKAVASLSGPTDLSSRLAENDTIRDRFVDSVENYTNVYHLIDPNWETKHYDKSPIKLVEDPINTLSYIPPIRMYATEFDSVPWQQGDDMREALETYHPTADVEFYEILGSSKHAFNYWHEMNTAVDPPICVSAQVIAFFDLHQ